MLSTGSQAVHRADPGAKVVMGGLAWNLQFLDAILSHPACLSQVEAINLHNYYETWADEPLERIPVYVGRAEEMLQAHGLHQSLWMAEVGYSNFRQNGRVSAQVPLRHSYEHTAGYQAQSLFRALTLIFATGKVLSGRTVVQVPLAEGCLSVLVSKERPKRSSHARSSSLGSPQLDR